MLFHFETQKYIPIKAYLQIPYLIEIIYFYHSFNFLMKLLLINTFCISYLLNLETNYKLLMICIFFLD